MNGVCVFEQLLIVGVNGEFYGEMKSIVPVKSFSSTGVIEQNVFFVPNAYIRTANGLIRFTGVCKLPIRVMRAYRMARVTLSYRGQLTVRITIQLV